MRIISGKNKGRKLLLPSDKMTRPLKDLTKESIFNIINHSKKFELDIKNSLVLDLFSGMGSFGLECLSRGALNVTFIENYKKALIILKKNISNLDFNKKSQIIEKNIFDYFNYDFQQKFYDLIFIDPPYKERKLSFLLEKIFKNKILKKNGIIIIHRHKNENENFIKNFEIVEKKIYGISKIIIGKLK